METCFHFFTWLLFVFLATSHADCNLLQWSQSGTSYIDTESEDSIITMCLGADKSKLSKWEKYQCEYIKNRNDVKMCWPQRRMSHCAPGNLKGVILLYHGFSTCPNYYNELADILQDDCWHIYQPLNIGHGYNYCNSTHPSCIAGKYNLTNLPKSRQGYIDYVNMMIDIINDEVSIIKQCEANNNNIQIVVGGISFGAPLAAATVILSGNNSIFTKQMLFPPEWLYTMRSLDYDIYHCLLNSSFRDECLPKYWKLFVAMNFIANPSNILNINVIDFEYSEWERFLLFFNGFLEFVVEDTPHIQLANDIMDLMVGWHCEDDIKYRDRGGFCQFTVRDGSAQISFSKYLMDIVAGTADDYDYDDDVEVDEIETLLVLTERDGTIWNSFAADYVNYFYDDQQVLLKNKSSSCMWLVQDECFADIDSDDSNICGVPHSFLSLARNTGDPPYYLYWNETLMNGIITWLNDEETYNDNFMVPFDDWDGSRNQCVELDLIDRPKKLLFQTNTRNKLKEIANIDYNQILYNIMDGDSSNIDEIISDFMDKFDVSLSIMTLLKDIKKYYDNDDMKLNEFRFHRDIIKYIQQNEDFRYWIWKLLDIKIDSIHSLSELLDKIFYKLSGRNMNDKILKFADLFEEFEHWKHKLSEVDIDSIQSLSEFLDNILDEFVDDDLKDKIKDYKGDATKLRRIIYRIKNLGAIDDDQPLEKEEDQSQISMIFTLSATNLVIIISFIIYCCSHQQHTYQYQKAQLTFSYF